MTGDIFSPENSDVAEALGYDTREEETPEPSFELGLELGQQLEEAVYNSADQGTLHDGLAEMRQQAPELYQRALPYVEDADPDVAEAFQYADQYEEEVGPWLRVSPEAQQFGADAGLIGGDADPRFAAEAAQRAADELQWANDASNIRRMILTGGETDPSAMRKALAFSPDPEGFAEAWLSQQEPNVAALAPEPTDEQVREHVFGSILSSSPAMEQRAREVEAADKQAAEDAGAIEWLSVRARAGDWAAAKALHERYGYADPGPQPQVSAYSSLVPRPGRTRRERLGY